MWYVCIQVIMVCVDVFTVSRLCLCAEHGCVWVCVGVVNVGVCGCGVVNNQNYLTCFFKNFMLNCRDARLYQQWSEQVCVWRVRVCTGCTVCSVCVEGEGVYRVYCVQCVCGG